VGAELQSRIVAAAARLDYRTNLAARALVSRRSGLVGLVTGKAADSLFAEAVDALERRLRAGGYALLRVSRESGGVGTAAALLPRDAEAIAFVGTRPVSSEIELLGRSSQPWVCLSDAPAVESPFIDFGRRRGGTLAARYLLDLGHSRLGVSAAAGAETRLGVAAALVAGDGTLIASAEGDEAPNPENSRSAICALLDWDEPPTAIVCGSDLEALAAVRECALRGIHVPGEVSVVGFGNQEFARHAMPALTTIRVSAGAIGTEVGEALLSALRGEAKPVLEVPVKLVVRETTGVQVR
jgi:LacI family transcriptional regulator